MQIKFETDKFVKGSGKLICKRSSSIDLMSMGDDDSPITPQLPSPKDLEGNNSFTALCKDVSNVSTGSRRNKGSSDRKINSNLDIKKSSFRKDIESDEVLEMVQLGIPPERIFGESRSRSQMFDQSSRREPNMSSCIRGESVSPKGSGRQAESIPDEINVLISTDNSRKEILDRSGVKISQTGLTSELSELQFKNRMEDEFAIPGSESFQFSVESLVHKLKIMKIDKMREGYTEKRMNTINMDEIPKRLNLRSKTSTNPVLDMARIMQPT
jgi:hypothetical protein